MKYLLTLLIFFSLHLTYGQQCSCSKKPELEDVISCEATHFKNGAKLFWEYNCDSSWITFQNGNHKKKIFELEKEFIELSGRLGYRSWTEYPNSFLIENSLVSGCCQPAEYILFDKNNGTKKSELGTFVFISNEKQPYIITLKSSTKLLYTDLETNKSCPIKIPENIIEETLQNSDELYPEKLFENIHLKNGILSLSLKYKESKEAEWKVKIISLDIIHCKKTLKNAGDY